MIRSPAVFVDSDVIISSLISKRGASYLLLNQPSLKLFVSNYSLDELKIVVRRLGIRQNKLEELIKKRFKDVKLEENLSEIKDTYKDYVKDINDAHIIARAVESKAGFLISYNIRDFKIDKIKKAFNLICLRPAQFLQYLRSQEQN